MANPLGHWIWILFGTRFRIPLRGLSGFQGIGFRIPLRVLSGFRFTLRLVGISQSIHGVGPGTKAWGWLRSRTECSELFAPSWVFDPKASVESLFQFCGGLWWSGSSKFWWPVLLCCVNYFCLEWVHNQRQSSEGNIWRLWRFYFLYVDTWGES